MPVKSSPEAELIVELIKEFDDIRFLDSPETLSRLFGERFPESELVLGLLSNSDSRKVLSENCEPNFTQLGVDFFRCYFGDKPNATITDVSKILGVRGERKWAKKIQALIELKILPAVKRKGRFRVTPATLAAWFEIQAGHRADIKNSKG